MASELNFLDPTTLAAISNLELRAKIAVEGFLSGLHRSPYHGFSVEFSEYRHYHPGDDIRHVDWKLFARSGQYHIKKYEAETNLRCTLLLDCSASMGYGAETVTKLQYAQTLASALAYFIMGQRDAVGLMTFDDKILDYLPSRYRRGHLMQILQTLAALSPGKKTDLSRPISDLTYSLNRRGLTILISDLLDDPDAVVKGLQGLRFQGNDIIVFHTLDRAELTFPFDRLTEFEDAENQDLLKAVPQAVRSAYLKELETFCAFYRHKFRASGIGYCLLDTSKPLNTALSAYLTKRAKSF